MSNEHAPRLMKLRQVLAVTTLGRSTVYDKMNRGEFPRPLKLGARAIAWRAADIDAWLATRPETKGGA